MICENPYNQPHILTQHFPLKPDIIDKDRTRRGDFYEKPTQYWFVNCQPQENFFLENLQTDDKDIKVIERVRGEDRKTQRSMISPVYANRFIREFILEEKKNYE